MLSFDFTNEYVNIIKGNESFGKIKVTSACHFELPRELVKYGGLITDIPKMAAIIHSVLANKHMFDKEAVVTFSSNLLIYKELIVPQLKSYEDQITLIQDVLNQEYNMEEDYSFTYSVIDKFKDNSDIILKILTISYPCVMRDELIKLFDLMGIKLKAIIPYCYSISSIIAESSKLKNKMSALMVQVESNFISISFFYYKIGLFFSRYVSKNNEESSSEDSFYNTIVDNVFRSIQYHRSKYSEDIHNILFYGSNYNLISRLVTALNTEGFNANHFNISDLCNICYEYKNFTVNEYINAIGAMKKSNIYSKHTNFIDEQNCVKASNKFVQTVSISTKSDEKKSTDKISSANLKSTFDSETVDHQCESTVDVKCINVIYECVLLIIKYGGKETLTDEERVKAYVKDIIAPNMREQNLLLSCIRSGSMKYILKHYENINDDTVLQIGSSKMIDYDINKNSAYNTVYTVIKALKNFEN